MSYKPTVLWVTGLVLVAVVAFWLGGRGGAGVPDTAANSQPPAASSASSPAVAESAEATSGSTESAVRVGEVRDDGMARVPSRYQFAGVSRVQTGRDFEDWMAHFSEADQKLLRAFDEHNFGVYQHRTPEAIAWMAANGYPMPEDVLAAQAIDTPRLQKMALSGNHKAAFLLKDRRLNRLASEMQSQGLTYEQAVKQLPAISLKQQVRFSRAVYKSVSPYKAYLTARDVVVTRGQSRDAYEDAKILSALTWAKSLGDVGASKSSWNFVNADPSRRDIRQLLHAAARAGAVMMMRNKEASLPGCMPPHMPYPRSQ